MDGCNLLQAIPDKEATAVFFDPQYRTVLDKMKYGNGEERQKRRHALPQMDMETIVKFIHEIDRVLKPSGHLFFWVDKFMLVEGTKSWFDDTSLKHVDMVTWDKTKIGMGYRTRRRSEYMLILQKEPTRAKGIWKNHSIPDVWTEAVNRSDHPHIKPVKLIKTLIEAVTIPGDLVVDPAAGSFKVLDACIETGRQFIGADLTVGEKV